MIYLTSDDLLKINSKFINYENQLNNVQYPQGLNMVAEQPAQSFYGQEAYPTIWLKAAFILQKIIKQHLFIDGNKRTGYAATWYFLYQNNYLLKMNAKKIINFTLAIAKSTDSENKMKQIAYTLKKYSNSTID